MKGAGMSYKIAIGSSDGKKVDLKFGEVTLFTIYEVDGLKSNLSEIREVRVNDKEASDKTKEGCTGSGCNDGGCSGNGGGCNGPADVIDKIALIEDCRCVVCKKIGFQAQKQFEKKAISVFDVECDITEALEKIIYYYHRLDQYKPIRKL